MPTLDDVMLLFRAFTLIARHQHAYMQLFDDFSGAIFCYDDIEIATFDDVADAHAVLLGLIKEIKWPCLH